jgi:hypothetical protein
MANRVRTFWTSDRVHGPAGRFRVVVSRSPAAAGNPREVYSATLMCDAGKGDQPCETEFWRNSSPPHDADKLAFRERARRAAEQPAAQPGASAGQATDAE